jgi:drug/metabolite transporter (DMT)-like permease
MAFIWGTNYSIVKTAFQEVEPQAFNAMRMTVASAAFLLVIGLMRLMRLRQRRGVRVSDGLTVFHTPAPVSRRDWLALAGLGLVGHALYQYFFIGGLARTSVANSSLILAATPVLIALVAAAIGHERIGRSHWFGAAISAVGIYLVVGRDTLGGSGLTGDLMMVAAVFCWAIYTLAARPLMERHSPVAVTGLSMAFGTLIFVPFAWGNVQGVDWAGVSIRTLLLIVYSALFALCVAYTIWYMGVRQIGSARTAVYSNLIPVFAMASAIVFLDEPVGLRKLLGAAAVLAGVAFTRASPRMPIPAEE